VVADSTDVKSFYNYYKNGYIDWSPASGAHTITGPVYDKWMTQGGPKSGFAYPITDEASTADNKARINNFSIDALYPRPQMVHT